MIFIKVLLIIVFLVLYLVFFVFTGFNGEIKLQIVSLIVLLLLNTKICSFKDTVGTVKWILPFLIIYTLFGFIFHYISLFDRTDWLQDTYLKLVMFPNSLFAFKISFALVSLKDIYNLPVPMFVKSQIITIKAVMIKGQSAMERFKSFLETYHYIKNSKVKLNGSLILSLYFYLENECQNQWGVLNNKLSHLKID